jgi:hypothetical protein
MRYLKPDPEALNDLEYTPQFYCQRCSAGVPALCLSERKQAGGVLREISCPACHCLERVLITLAEDFSGWLFFQVEAPDQDSGPECAGPTANSR